MDFDSLKISRDSNTIKTEYNSPELSSTIQNNNKLGSDINVADPEDKKTEDRLKDDNSSFVKKSLSADERNKEKHGLKGNFEEKLENAVKIANSKLMGVNRQFSYSIHEKTNRVVVKITDTDTGEIIKEIPSEKTLDLFGKLQELAGIIVDEKR